MLDKQQTLKQQAEQHPSLSEWSIKLKSLDDVSKELRALIKTIPFGAFLLHTDAFVEAVDFEIKVKMKSMRGGGGRLKVEWKEKKEGKKGGKEEKEQKKLYQCFCRNGNFCIVATYTGYIRSSSRNSSLFAG